MPAMTYPIGTPEDSRWAYYLRVPAIAEDWPAERIVRWAQHALAHYRITYRGNPGEVALVPLDGHKVLLFNTDIDPATVVVPSDVPPLPPTPAENRIERIRQARTTMRGGTSLSAAQQRTVLLDLIELVLGDDR